MELFDEKKLNAIRFVRKLLADGNSVNVIMEAIDFASDPKNEEIRKLVISGIPIEKAIEMIQEDRSSKRT